MSRRHELSMESYDRLFPSQDALPRGGFGNLIALPLQHEPRAQSNSVFLDERLRPHSDDQQWSFLASLPRIDASTVEEIADEAADRGSVTGVRIASSDEEDAVPWKQPPSRRRPPTAISEQLPRSVRAVLAQKLFVDKTGPSITAAQRDQAPGGFSESRVLQGSSGRVAGILMAYYNVIHGYDYAASPR